MIIPLRLQFKYNKTPLIWAVQHFHDARLADSVNYWIVFILILLCTLNSPWF